MPFVALLEAAGRLSRLGRMTALLLARVLGVLLSNVRALHTPAFAAAAHSLAGFPICLRFLFGASKIGIASALIALPFVMAIAAITNPYMKADLDYAHERSSAPEILDREGRWVGILPPANFSDWSDGSILPPDHAAIPLIDIPPIWRSCLVYLEDREFDRVSRWLGVDPIAVLKSGWQTLMFQRRRGASTLYMQVVRMLHGRSPSQHEAPGEVALRKMAELLGSSALVRMFDESDPSAAARFLGMHLPLVIGTSGSAFGEPLHGIQLASRILFARSSNALPPELQAILAAAVKAPIVIAPPGDTKGVALASARWKRAKERADHCLRNAFPADAPEMVQARERLAALEPAAPALDPKLAKLLPKDIEAAWRIMVNPTRRSLFFSRHELAALLPELDRVAGKDWRGRVVSIRLTTSASDNRVFGGAVEDVLKRLQASVTGLDLNLLTDRSQSDAADVVVACADPEGKVRQIYSNREGIFWRRTAPAGSIAKIAAAVALGHNSQPDSLYCRAPIQGIASSESGDPGICRHKEGWLHAKDAFARSNNEAIHWALRKTDPRVLATVASGLQLPPFGDTPPATALTIGTFELSPAEMLRLVGTIGAGLAGSMDDAPSVRIIEEVTTLDRSGHAAIETVRGRSVVAALDMRRMFTPRVRSFVATALRATSEENGTLHSLGSMRERLAGDLYAKTGTVSVAGATRDLHIAGTYMRKGRPWSFVVTVGSPSDAHPLGRRLVAGRFAPLAATALCGERQSSVAPIDAPR
jgi:penicillin-binding protein 1A